MRSGFWLWRPTLPPPVTVVRPLRDEKKEREQQCHVDLLSLTFHCTTMISDMKHYINEKNVYLADYVLHFSWYYCFPEIDNLHYLLHLMFLCILARGWVCLNKEKTWSHVFKMNTQETNQSAALSQNVCNSRQDNLSSRQQSVSRGLRLCGL